MVVIYFLPSLIFKGRVDKSKIIVLFCKTGIDTDVLEEIGGENKIAVFFDREDKLKSKDLKTYCMQMSN